MNKKILIGSIIAVVILVLVSSSSAINVRTEGDNHPPEPPIINGPEYGRPGVEYSFTFVSTDSDGDNISYLIVWNGGEGEETDYYASGELVTRNHVYPLYKLFVIEARAKDTHGAESEWSYWLIMIRPDIEIITYIQGDVTSFEVLDGFIIRDVVITGDNISINGWKYPYDAPYNRAGFQEYVDYIWAPRFLGFIYQSNQVWGIAFGDIEWS